MPIVYTTLKIPLADGWTLNVVNSGPKSEVLLAFNADDDGPVRERITVHLTQGQAMQLARALAGVTPQMGERATFIDDEDEDTVP